MKVNVLNQDLSRLKWELVVVSVWLEFAINRKCCFSKLFSNRNGNGNQVRPCLRHCWNWFMEYLLQTDNYCNVLTNRGQKNCLLNNNLCSNFLPIFCMWFIVFFNKSMQICSQHLPADGRVHLPSYTSLFTKSVCIFVPLLVQLSIKSINQPTLWQARRHRVNSFLQSENKLASFHLDIKATNDGPHGLLNSLSVIVSYFWHYVTATDAGIKRQWRWVVIPAHQRNVWNAAGH